MRLIRLVALFFLVIPSAYAATPPASFADLVEKLSPAVVNISTTQKIKQQAGIAGLPFQMLPPGAENSPELEPFREFFDRFGQMQKDGAEREVTSLGSGFIISKDGYVITNNHVVEKAEEIKVIMHSKDEYDAKVIGRDPKTDLALLKIEGKNLPFVALGDSDKMRVGDWVLAIGNPFGLGGSVTQGIISAQQRSINAGPFDDFIQTDAPINRGNSGGPLFNMDGEVIGINTAIFSPTGGSVGIGFAIPTALAKTVIAQLKEHGRTYRGWLGVKIQLVSDEVAESVGLDKAHGALVLEVEKGSPADKAKLKAGDIILEFDGKKVEEMRFLPRIVAETKIGKEVDVDYWRDGKKHDTELVVGELDEDAPVASITKEDNTKSDSKDYASETFQGMELAELNDYLRKRLRMDDHSKGVVVIEVESGSEVAKQGVRARDVITEVNSSPVKNIGDVKNAFKEAKKKGRKYALVKIARGKEDAFIPLPTAEK